LDRDRFLIKWVDLLGTLSIFIAECSDGTYFSGIDRNIYKYIDALNRGKRHNTYLNRFPWKRPISMVFKEEGLPLAEALIKYKTITNMQPFRKRKLIRTGKWPAIGLWGKYLKNKDSTIDEVLGNSVKEILDIQNNVDN